MRKYRIIGISGRKCKNQNGYAILRIPFSMARGGQRGFLERQGLGGRSLSDGKNQKRRLTGLLSKGDYGSKCTGVWDVVVLWEESQPMTLDREFVKEEVGGEAGQVGRFGQYMEVLGCHTRWVGLCPGEEQFLEGSEECHDKGSLGIWISCCWSTYQS